MIRRPIYNLEFEPWCPEINLFGYRFYRTEDYETQLRRLQHRVNMRAEFDIQLNVGEHAVTAYVDLPKEENVAILEWVEDQTPALMDILLLLSIFTGREVFAGDRVNKDENEKVGALIVGITRDPRRHYFGGVLRTSIPYEANKELPKADEDFSNDFPYDIGFEKEINRIYLLIRSEEWQKKYHRGYFLLLARQAFLYQTLESSFLQCWTIWEHLFAILNQNWLSKDQIERLSSIEKISFLLVEYALKEEIDKASQNRIADFAEIRNRLIHYGRFPKKDKVHDDAILFIHLTEFILAKILGLLPSNVFNTVEKLEAFMKEKSKPKNNK
jgi:hypothetical protein